MCRAAATWGYLMIMVQGMQGPVLWRCTAPLCGTPWGRVGSPHWELMPAQGRCSRWPLHMWMLL